MNELIPIQDVTIVLTYPDDTTEQFTLEAPNGQDPFRAGFRRYNILPDFRNGQLSWQRGNRKYQLVAEYDYASHQMDIRKLLVAKSIELRFPPNFSLTEEYQSADVLLANTAAAKNYLAGFAAGTDQARDAVPSGGVTLEFEGVEALTEAQMMDYNWYQPVNLIDGIKQSWSGHSAYSIINEEYIQFSAQGSSAPRNFTCVGLGDLQDYEIHADFADFGDADNNGRIFGLRCLIGTTDMRFLRYYPNFLDNGDWVYVDEADGTQLFIIEGSLNLASEQIVSMKFKKIGDTIDFNCWLPSVQDEPDYGVGEYAYTEVVSDEVGPIGISGVYGFNNWRCTKFDVTKL